MNAPYMNQFRVTQSYKGVNHKGMDLVGISSKNIYSTINGIVENSGWDAKTNDGGMGLYIKILGEDGNHYYFAHLSQSKVKKGNRVVFGQIIGTEGSTGHSTGSHLHYEVRRQTHNSTYFDISVISGIPNKIGIYDGGDVMKREDVIDIIKEVLNGTATDTPSDWAKPSWDKFTKLGVIDGKRPDGYTDREEIITILDRALKK